MKAVILVGGEGTRLLPLTCNTPKPMVPILNRPFLEHMIEYLKGHGIHDIILALCYLPDRIQSYFNDGSTLGVKLSYVVESSPLGTAGAVKNVEEFLDDTFIVCNGDILTDLDLSAMLAFHREKGAEATIALTSVDDPTAYGVAETDAELRVRRFIEKPSWDAVTSNLINAGAYILEPTVLNAIPKGAYYMFEQGLFPALLQARRRVYAYPSQGYWTDIGTPSKYLATHHDLLLGRAQQTLLGNPDHDFVWLGKDCQIHPTVHLSGPVVFGSGCLLERGVQVIGPAVIGPGSVIGEGSNIEEAVIWRETRLGHQVMVRNAIIANDCRIADGVFLGEGTVLGDGVVVGPGNKLERGIRIWPGRTLEANTISF